MPSDVSLKIDKFNFNPQAGSGDKVLEIAGSSTGLLATLLKMIGVNEKSYMTVSSDEITFRFANLRGVQYIVCPLNSITCSLSALEKPFGSLVWGIIVALAGLGVTLGILPQAIAGNSLSVLALVGIGIGAFMIVNYFISSSLVLLFSTGEITGARGLAFSVTKIGNRTIDLPYLAKVVAHLNDRITSATGRSAPIRSRPGVSLDADGLIDSLLDEEDTSVDNSDVFDTQIVKGIKPDPTESRQAFLAGREAYRAGDYQTAVDELTRALDLKPDFEEARKGLDAARQKLRKANRA
jgi:hypothetical protein